ncbi:MAG: DUF4286 family protein [Chitinophagaceae bacterium]|jgi:hypothetical protein|nr:DUF4286 family protein [Chitinophagaceae bacterium]
MFIYNISLKLEWSIHEAWLLWMQEVHIPEIMETGCFTEYRFVRLLDIDEADGPTYAVQFFAATREDYERYITHHAPALREDSQRRWGNGFIGFRSLMKVVN